jgi:hypothetical protein
MTRIRGDEEIAESAGYAPDRRPPRNGETGPEGVSVTAVVCIGGDQDHMRGRNPWTVKAQHGHTQPHGRHKDGRSARISGETASSLSGTARPTSRIAECPSARVPECRRAPCHGDSGCVEQP